MEKRLSEFETLRPVHSTDFDYVRVAARMEARLNHLIINGLLLSMIPHYEYMNQGLG
jgi:hypothetical protein